MKTVLITGVSKGLGLHLSTSLLKHGNYIVYGVSRSSNPDIEQLKADSRFRHLQHDLADSESVSSIGKFIKDNPIGTFLVSVRGHAFTIKNGVVIGNVEDAIKTRKVLQSIWKIV